MHAIALLTLLATTPAQGFGAPPSFSARLLAAHEAVAPGGATELAIEVTIEPDWHIYHRNPVATGFPTTFDFELPPGFSVGEVRYPLPKMGEMSGIAYQGYGAKVVFLAPLFVDSSVKPGDEAAIKVKVNALACLESCIPVDAEAKLSLPVRGEQGRAANEELFAQAGKKMPPPLDKAPQIASARVLLSQDKLRPDDTATLAVEIELEEGWHIQASDPGVEGLIPSKLTIEPIDGLLFGDQSWPAPKEIEFPVLGKVRQYDGKLVIRTPVTLTDSKMAPGVRKLWLMFEYQACNEEGSCLPPETAEAAVKLEIASSGAEVRKDESGIELAMVQFDATPTLASAARADAPAQGASGPTPLALALLLGLLGGLILNVMPCVLPVISIKILSFVQQGGDDPGRIFRMGLAFCAGIMVWFWGFAALSSAGHLPLQYPSVVIGVGSVLFLMALNLFGVFEVTLPGSAAGTLTEFASKEGYLGSFFKGFLATLLGTACTAPFLATALVYAVTQPAWIVFLVFSAAGLGMALPYLVLAWKPGWLKFLPKPGAWMVTFKQAAGFVLVATAIWLLWIVGGLLGANGVVWTAAFWTFLAFSAWLIGKIDWSWSARGRVVTWASAGAVAIFGGWFSFAYMYQPEERHKGLINPDEALRLVAAKGWDEDIPWVPYAPGLAEELARRGYTVYVDYTAKWCASCQYNKAAVLRSDEIWSMMRELNVIPIEADFTNRDPTMLKEINSFGSPSVPLNLIYSADRPSEVQVMPVLLTNAVVREGLRTAGPSKAPLPGSDAGSATGGPTSRAKVAVVP